MKNEIGTLDATPSKRTFLSIIADYDLNRSICELVDNALDVWAKTGKLKDVTIKISLETSQQAISVEDNAGGVPKAELQYMVAPGESGTDPTDETIGIFGVGTKRAVVALAQDIKIRTRYTKEPTHEIDLDDQWLEKEPGWVAKLYEVDEITEGTTIVDLQRLRIQITDDGVLKLKEYLSAIYARFLGGQTVTLVVNGEIVQPKFFDNWAYPPRYEPRRYKGILKTGDDREVRVEVIAGLTLESSPAAGEYGVYFYCNERLVGRALKSYDVGFTRGLAGLPHPKVSLTRVLVFLNGDSRDMPWNSSKSDISTKHHVFQALHSWLVQVVKDYATLSRIWMGEWPKKVFRYESGEIKDEVIIDFPTARKSFLPSPPKSRPRYSDVIAQKNAKIAKKKPWTRGLYEGVIAADLISRGRLEQKNQYTLILLDSTLEIAFKEFLVNESGGSYSNKRLLEIFGNRSEVHKEVKKYATADFSATTWQKIEYYYRLRCKLVHEKVTAPVPPSEIEDFRQIVEKVLRKLFRLSFE